MRPNPRPQEIYRHFKGNIYQIVTLARHSEDGVMMVVYQQLYAPFDVYVRPLEMFMSRIDTRKYPDERQVYRFEKVDPAGENTAGTHGGADDRSLNERQRESAPSGSTGTETQRDAGGGFELDAGLVEFLDADSYEKKLQILSALHPRITDAMIDTMAVSLDTEVKEGDIENRYNEIKNCLLTMERFECNRLRS
ncbi:MAG: DUF1653 domain-containing protein [Lachnospiraceae bacterium]|jgi:hypothetical protein|nr:DUF1653 domain-containing protein [Lachnospiraceae bacterium]